MDTRLHGSRRAFIAVVGGVGLVAPFAVVAQAETEAERRARIDREAKSTAWMLGASLSKAVLMLMINMEADTKKYFSLADRAAALLGLELKPLPSKIAPQEASKYLSSGDLVVGTGQTISKNYGKEHAALYELAIKTNVAGTFYFPEQTKQTQTVADQLKSWYQAAKLPSHLWTGFFTAIREGRPLEEVNRLSWETIQAVFSYLNPPK